MQNQGTYVVQINSRLPALCTIQSHNLVNNVGNHSSQAINQIAFVNCFNLVIPLKLEEENVKKKGKEKRGRQRRARSSMWQWLQ
jgi:hypothetical protein